MISDIGCEDCCGVLRQWGGESEANGSESWVDAYDGNDADVAGQHYRPPCRPLFGGYWGIGASCGSRGSYWRYGPLVLASNFGVRGLAEPL